MGHVKPLTPRQHRTLAFFGLGLIVPCIIAAFFYTYLGYPAFAWMFFALTVVAAVCSILNYRRSLR